MSLSESAAFTYESTAHSTNVLLSLDDQRRRDELCDITVLVEGRPFRAHRAVLAACSSYLHAQILGRADAELRVSLPEEVTVKGFEPVIQFAYTAKLLLSQDNVDDVCRCVDFLGVRDIEETCFQFLRLKSLDSAADQRERFPAHCRKAGLPRSLLDERDVESWEAEDLLEHKDAQTPQCKLRVYQGDTEMAPSLPDRAGQTHGTLGLEMGAALPSLCPKYRKFQKAFGTDRVHPVDTGFKGIRASAQPSEMSEPECPPGAQDGAGLPPTLKCEESKMVTEHEDPRKDSASQGPWEGTEAAPLPHSSPTDPPGLYSLSLLHTYDQYGADLDFPGLRSTSELPEKPLVGPEGREEKPFAEFPEFVESQDLQVQPASSPGAERSCARSSVEREVAEHLAQGFWSDVCSSASPRAVQLPPATAGDGLEQTRAQKRPECPWLGIRISESPEPGPRTFATLSSVGCPFMSTLNTGGRPGGLDLGTEDVAPGPQREPCPYACVITLGEDSETDTEGDSEPCSAREPECEVKLPFNAQRIISLSRNDFQSLLKMHKLTPEQLDCVHDIRRRSKNRIAAQRCRKRKLDCLQSLASEIRKLQQEKDSLLKERDHILSTLGETRQNLTGLCQQVCQEAALSPEQIQILAKYSASECPLSFLVPEKDKSAPDSAPMCPPSSISPEEPPATPAGERSPSCPGEKGSGPGCVRGQAAPEQAGLGTPCRPARASQTAVSR